MAKRQSAASVPASKRRRLRQLAQKRKADQIRRLELERLEQRLVMTGPQLAGIQPNSETLLDFNGSTNMDVAPRSLTFYFDESQRFNDATLSSSVRVSRAGADGIRGTGDDIIVQPGFLGSKDSPNQNQIVLRFQEQLPDDLYRVELFAFDDPGNGIMALRNTSGEVLLPRTGGADRDAVDFELDLGAQIRSVVPQPITRNPDGSLSQDRDKIIIYFNDDDLHEAPASTNSGPTVVNPDFYKLMFTKDTASNRDDLIFTPTSVEYDPTTDIAVLTFADVLEDLPAGVDPQYAGQALTYRLRVGTDEIAPPAPTVLDLQGPGTPEVGFDISLVFPDASLTQSQQEIIHDAAQRWEEIIIGDLPQEGLIDDIEITVRAQAIDGVGANIAVSVPTGLRRDSFLPFSSEIRLDAFDVGDAELHQQQQEAGEPVDWETPTLFEVMVREIGFSLGFQRLWDEFSLTRDLATADPRYIGPNALREYNAQFNLTETSIPLENLGDREGRSDVVGSTWREEFIDDDANPLQLNNELFTGFPSQTDLNLVSRMTIGAFEDLGYVVDYDAADDLATGNRYRPPADPTLTDQAGSSFDTALDLGSDFDTSGGDIVSTIIKSSIDHIYHNNGMLNVIADGSSYAEAQYFVIRDKNGLEVKFEFDSDGTINEQTDPVVPILFTPGSSIEDMTIEIADKINQAAALTGTNFAATAAVFGGHFVLLSDDSNDLAQSVAISDNFAGVVTLDPLVHRFDQPGGADEPGHRQNQVEEHILGDSKDYTTEIATVYYNFKDFYGFDPDGNTLSNVITPEQMVRAREIFEIYANFLGVQFVETANEGITIATGDMRAVRWDVPTGPGSATSISGGGIVVLDSNESWTDDYGDDWFREAMRQIGQSLGLGQTFELPGLNILGSAANSDLGITNGSQVEPVFPGDSDLIHGRRLYRPEQSDVDIYQVDLNESGLFSVETFAERMKDSSPLDTVITIWTDKVDRDGNPVLDSDGRNIQVLIARNDDYYSEDSFLELQLEAGRYYIGVSASGNDDYNPHLDNSGFGGKSEGDYELRVTFRAPADDGIADDTRTRFDGDSDGKPGGVYNFWFRTAPRLDDVNPALGEHAVIFIDKVNEPPVGDPSPNGRLDNPFNQIDDAVDFIAAQRLINPDSEFIVRIVGNGGADGDITTVDDNESYQIGFQPPFELPLEDGSRLDVPRNTTFMVDAGAIFKMRRSSINVGSESPVIDRSGGAFQVLGVPFLADASGTPILDGSGDRAAGTVFFTSYNDEATGADTNPQAPQSPAPGDYGGIIYRTDAETVEAQKQYEKLGIFLNYVNHADFRYGGGKILVNSFEQSVTPVHMIEARPTVSYNSFEMNSEAALSADPNSFLESNFHDHSTQFPQSFTSDYQRVGPEMHHNSLRNNTTNGIKIRIDVLPNDDIVPQTVSARWDDTSMVHVLTDPLIIQGTPGGSFLEHDVPPVELITFGTPAPSDNGTLNVGDSHSYRLTYVDAEGNESPVSEATTTQAVDPLGVILLEDLPGVPFNSNFVGRRLYRSENGGAGDFTWIALLDANDTTFLDRGVTIGGVVDLSITGVQGVRRARPDARLRIDPGTVVKADQGRIEVGIGAQFIAEGLSGEEVIFTSRQDDRYGGSRSFDTNNDDTNPNEALPSPGSWGGIVALIGSTLSIDNALVSFGGAGANAIEIHQADARITNSVIKDNEIGLTDPTRSNVGFTERAAIFVRGAQPIIVNNLIMDNRDRNLVDNDSNNSDPVSAISINVNAMTGELVRDYGRSTGLARRFTNIRDNQGPLIDNNQLSNNGLNGIDIRTGVLTTEVVFDDTDIVHIVRDEAIDITNKHTVGGLRMESRPGESLVVKMLGANAGFRANGNPLDITDPIGGYMHILGQPGFPVIVTSLHDDTVGAGFQPNGDPQTDTGNDSNGTQPRPGDWNSFLIDQYANDRNVAIGLEQEPVNLVAPGSNFTANTAQFLGSIAPNLKSGDDLLRLGFEVHGFLTDVNDIDVYSFKAKPGTEVWLDIDRTSQGLDSIIELINADGDILAQSNDSVVEQGGGQAIYQDSALIQANPLQKQLQLGKDYGTTNAGDAGMRVVLPGSAPAGGLLTYHVRVRSSSLIPGDPIADLQVNTQDALEGGHSAGVYQLQIRLRELDETPGSTIQYSDIRYARNGIEVIGQPKNSPLQGDAVEILNNGATDDTNDNRVAGSVRLGNIVDSPNGSLSFSGSLGLKERPGFGGHPGFDDVDFFRFDVTYDNVQSIFDSQNPNNPELNNPTRHAPVIFDLDYGDQVSQADTIMTLYNEDGVVLAISNDSNIADDRSAPLNGADVDDLGRGSPGEKDPFIGPVELPEGTYYVSVTAVSTIPHVLSQTLVENPTLTTTRLEPIDSLQRIAEDRIDGGLFPQVVIVDDDDNVGPVITDIVPPQGSVVQANIDFISGSETQALNRVDLPGLSNIAESAQFSLIDGSSIVPFSLGDVKLYVSEDAGGTNTQALRIIDPFTGHQENFVDIVNEDFGSLVIHPVTNEIHSFTTEQSEHLNYADDTNNATRWISIDDGTGEVYATAEDGIDTFELSGTNVVRAHNFAGNRIGDGVDFEGTGFGTINNSLELLAVGSRLWPGGNPFLPNPQNGLNVLYRFDPNTGVATSAPFPDRTGNARIGGAGTQIVERGILDLDGDEGTGLAIMNGRVFVVSDGGGLYEIFTSPFGFNPNSAGAVAIPLGVVEDENGVPIPFEALEAGPANVEGGRFSSMLFGASVDGQLYAFDPDRVALNLPTGEELEPIFYNGRRTVQMNSVAPVTGLAFSTLDFNLWHVSGSRGTDEGHGIEEIADGSRDPALGGSSLWFGFESRGANGIATNPSGAAGSYDFPGGAQGQVETREFSLGGYSEEDIPILYFNYFLETEDTEYSGPIPFPGRLATDTFRVYIADDSGKWELLGTSSEGGAPTEISTYPLFDAQEFFDNNNTPQRLTNPNLRGAPAPVNNSSNTTAWRQARVPLGPYAGRDNLRLRFDFTTWGDSNQGDPLTTGDQLRAIPGNDLRDEQSIEFLEWDEFEVPVGPPVRFETDLGATFVAPSGSKLTDGQQFVIDGIVYEFDNDDLNGNPADLDKTLDNYGDGFNGALPGDVIVPFHPRMTPEQVAEKMQIAIETNFVEEVRTDGIISDAGFGGAPANDTKDTAVRTDLLFGEYTYTATGAIGDNVSGVLNDASLDVDIYKIRVNEGSLIHVDVTGDVGVALFNEFSNFPLALDFFDPLDPTDPIEFDFFQNAPPITNAPLPQLQDPPGFPDAPRVGNGTASGIPFPNGDPGAATPEGYYYVAVSNSLNLPPLYDPTVEGSGFIPGALSGYNLTINVSNPDAPAVDGDFADRIHGDDREVVDFAYTFINTHRNGNRVNVPNARIVSTDIVGAPNTPYARFLEGTPGVAEVTNERMRMHAGMSNDLVANQAAHVLADHYADGRRPLFNVHDESVDLVGLTFTANDLGPTGNTPGALGINRYGYVSEFNNQVVPGDSLDDPAVDGFISGHGLFEASKAGNNIVLPFFPGAIGAQNNDFEGVYIDDIIIGFAERGELVTGVETRTINAGSDFITNPLADPDAVLDGTYSVELRKGSEYGVSIRPEVPDQPTILANYRAFDTNTRQGSSVSLIIPAGAEIYEKQKFTVSDGVNSLTFEYDDLDHTLLNDADKGVESGNVQIGYFDYDSADVIAGRVLDAFNSSEVQAVLKIVASTSDGADEASDGSTSNVITLHGQNIVGDVASDVNVEVYNPFDFGEVTADVTGVRQQTIYKDGRYQTIVLDDSVQGDSNVDRPQGQILISSNVISNVSNYGVFVDSGVREGASGQSALPNNPHAGPVRNLVELNIERLVPGPAIVNNLLIENGAGGVFFSGDPNGPLDQLAPIPVGRIVNNTFYGGGNGTGVNVSQNAAPTLLNNIFSDLAFGVFVDGTSAANTILTGNLYNDNGTHSNIGLGSLAIDNDVLNGPMFVDEFLSNFYLASGSQAIDSSVDSVSDREALVEVKEPLGIPRSPVIAPDRDQTFQLRVDDSESQTPSGQVIDRGALDRADRSGPTAFLTEVSDNDSEQLDIDPSETVVVRVDDEIHTFFEVQLFDGFGEVSSRGGIGIKDTSVVDATVTVTRNGEFLEEGVDYHYAYNATSNRIRLTSLSGIWPTDSTYVITLNNRDRFVLEATAGGSVTDGDQFTIEQQLDPNDPNSVLKQVFEYDSGYTIQVPQPLTVQVPVAGGGPGGIGDGQTFTINDPATPDPAVVFEFDSNNTLLDNSRVRVPFTIQQTHEEIAETMVTVIGAAGLGLSPSSLGNGGLHIAIGTEHTFDRGTTPLNSFGSSLAVSDGDSFTIDGNDFPLTRFEFDLDNSVAQGAIRVPFRVSSTRDDIGDAIVTAIQSQNMGLNPQNFGGGNVHVGGTANDTVMEAISTSNLSLSGTPGVARGLEVTLPLAGGGVGGITDSEFRVTNIETGVARTFEFDSDGNNTSGNIIINYNLNSTVSTREEIADAMVIALNDPTNNLGLGNATNLGNGTVALNGGIQHVLNPLSANISITGVAGGAAAVNFIPNTSFDAAAMALSIIDAINDSQLDVDASLRGGPTLFVEGATTISNISNFFLDGIKDLAENDLQPNQFSQETRFTILLGENRLDFGDNPDETVDPQFHYPTLLQDDGARHVIFRDNPLYLGTRVDSDANGQPTIDANGDGVDADTYTVVSTSAALTAGGGPVNGTFPLDILVPQTFTLTVPVDGGGAVQPGEQFTIDDGSGPVVFEFEDTANPGISGDVGVPFNVGSTARSIAGSIVDAIVGAGIDVQPKTLAGGMVHVGTRTGQAVTLGGGSSLTLDGQATSIADGDLITVSTGLDTFIFEFDNDLNFAEDNVIMTLSQGDTNQEIAEQIVGAMLSVDMRFTPVHTGDGLINMSGLDEDSPTGNGGDGVSFLGAFNSFVTTPIEVRSSGPGLLDAWVDFNRDGRWDNGEQVFSSEPINPGVNSLSISTPLGAVTGDTYTRFRISQLGGLGPRGLAASGEVEDYKITILPGDPPVANPDPQIAGDYMTDEDTPLIVSATNGLLDNDTDVNGDALTVLGTDTGPLVFTTVRGAEVTINADGSFSYDPTVSAELQGLFLDNPQIEVTDTFEYRAFDGFLFSDPAVVTLVVKGLNDNPIANPVTVLNAFEDGPLVNGFVDAFDIDSDDNFSQNPSLNTLMFRVEEDLNPGAPDFEGGEIVNKNDTSFTEDARFQFDPKPDVDFQFLAVNTFQDVDFTYVAIDSHGAESVPATVTIRVNGVNDIPLSNDMEILPIDGPTEDGAAITYTFDGDDVDSDDGPNDLIYHIVSGPSEGQVTQATPGARDFDFDPLGDFQDLSINDSRFVTFTYQTEDSHGAFSALGTVTVWVNGTNDAPTAINDPSNNSNIHDPLNFETDEDTIITRTTNLAQLVDNDVDVDRLDNLFVYDPSINGPVNDLSPLVITSTFGAEVTLFSNGEWQYNPLNAAAIQALVADEPGITEQDPTSLTDSFTYKVTDGMLESTNSATVNIFVTGENDKPIAFDDQFSIDEDNTGTFTEQLTVDDPDADDDASSLLVQITQQSIPPGLLVQDNANGTFTYRIDNAMFQDLGPGESRPVSFEFRALDRHGVRSDPGTITILVTGTNDPPVAVDDSGVINEVNTSIQIDVLANDLDPEANYKFNSADLFNIVQPQFGSVTANLSNGVLTYTPAPNFQGEDTFTYTVRDVENQVSNVATVQVITTDFPVTQADLANTFVGVPVDIDVIANDSDSDGINAASVQIASQPGNGTVEVLPSGEIRYTPNLGFTGPADAFEYTVADNLGARSAATSVNIGVSPNPTPHKNPIYAEDIDASGSINAKDPLEIVFVLRTYGIGVPLPVPPAAPFLTPADPPEPGVRLLYRDPNGNNQVDLVDAFMTIEELNRVMGLRGSGGGEGETTRGQGQGEGEAAAAVDSLMTMRLDPVKSAPSGQVVDANRDVNGDALLDALETNANNPHLERILEDLFRSGQVNEEDVDSIIGDVFGDE